MRVVSLVPSATETLHALGHDPVGCTRFCERPDLPHVGGTKNPELEAIRRLAPDVVVVDQHENRREDAEALTEMGVRVWSSDVGTVEQALDVVADLARLVGVEAPARPVIPARVGPRISVFVPIWRRPWMAIGACTYGASLLGRLGVDVVTGTDDPRYPVVELDALRRLELAAVLVPSEPYDFQARHVDDLREAFPGVDVRGIDGRDLFWWGTRTAAAARRLSAVIGDLAR